MPKAGNSTASTYKLSRGAKGHGRDAAEGTEGKVIASGTRRIVAGDAGVRIFAGLAPDLFARTGQFRLRTARSRRGAIRADLFHAARTTSRTATSRPRD